MDLQSLLLVGLTFGGFVLGFALAYLLRSAQARDARELAERVVRQSEAQRREHDAQMLDLMKGSFAKVSLQLMNYSQDNFMKLAEERLQRQSVDHARELESKKELIDYQLGEMAAHLNQVRHMVAEFEQSRAEKLGALGRELEQLTRTSAQLQRALADNKARGQWGERIAEDILRMSGLVEGVNYVKQTTVDGGADRRIRPDFIFRLPNGMSLHMDVKFPLDNYLGYVSAESKADRVAFRRRFLTDVRNRVREVSDRGYGAATENTIDCVLVFIPNEQVYRFIHEHDDGLIDAALKRKVIICSPLTLFIVLAIIRQAVENFKLQESSRDILKLLNQFRNEWDKYTRRMDEIGVTLDRARATFDDVRGLRSRQLEKPMAQIDALLHEHALNDASDDAPAGEG